MSRKLTSPRSTRRNPISHARPPGRYHCHRHHAYTKASRYSGKFRRTTLAQPRTSKRRRRTLDAFAKTYNICHTSRSLTLLELSDHIRLLILPHLEPPSDKRAEVCPLGPDSSRRLSLAEPLRPLRPSVSNAAPAALAASSASRNVRLRRRVSG